MAKTSKKNKASYPFDDEFRAAVDDDAWHCIVVRTIDWLPDELIALGYTIEQVQAYQDILKSKSFEELVELALQDEEKASPAELVLQSRDDRETFEKACALCHEALPGKRAIGFEVLMRTPGQEFKIEAQALVRSVVKTERESPVLEAIAYALSHLDIEERSQYLQEAATDSRPETRHAVAFSLGGCDDQLSAEMLIKLSADEDEDVRDWATFALHLNDSIYFRTDAVREALYARLHDSHIDTQLEAVEGLAKFQDERVLDVLIAFLEEEHPYMSMIEAAEQMAHPALLPYLLELSDSDRVKKAIAACSKNQSN